MTLEPKAWLWYISSFALLWFMLALRFSPLWLRVGMATLGLLCVHYVAFVLKRNSDERPSNNKLTIVGDAGTDAAAYIAAYLLPLFAVADPSANDLLVYALFLPRAPPASPLARGVSPPSLATPSCRRPPHNPAGCRTT